MSTFSNKYRNGDGMEELDRFPVVKDVKYENWFLDKYSAMSSETPHSAMPTHSDFGIQSEEMRLLEAVVDDPNQPSSSYLKRAKLGSGSKASMVRKSLMEQGYLKEHLFRKNGRGRTSIVLEPTPLALELVNRFRNSEERKTQ